jgi:transcriptional regulator with XRE-family HTH domain
MLMDVGTMIMREREAQGLARDDLAVALRKSVDLVAKIERGQRHISVEDLARVAETLGRPVDFFLGGPERSEVEQEFETLIQSAPLGTADAAELRRLSRVRTKQAIVNLVGALDSSRFGILRDQAWEAEIDVKLTGSTERWWRRRIEVLDRELPALRVRRSWRKRPPRLPEGFSVRLVDVNCSQEGVDTTLGKVKTVGNLVSYHVLFNPPLRHGEVAELCCEETARELFVMTREELARLTREGSLLQDEPLQETGASITVPTVSFRRKISFPKNYEISQVDVDATVGGMRLHDERDRISKQGWFSALRIHGRWVLELRVSRPVVGAAYAIRWCPPGEQDYKALLAANGMSSPEE